MPISSSVVWELRSAGNANNGGGFKTGATGSDFSQQNAAQYALTGLTSAGAGNTILSAAAAADMVGNVAQAISGTNITPGFFEVLSVVVGVSITFSTNSAAASICTGIAASGVINIGGALLTWAQLFGTGVMAAGQNAWVKGSFTITSAVIINFQAGTTSASFGSTVTGYSTTRGDTGQATLTTATNSIDLVAFTSTYGLTFKQITSSSTAGTRGDGWKAKAGSNSAAIAFDTCVMDGFSRAIVGNFSVDFMFASLFLRNTEIKNCTSTSDGARNSGYTSMVGCIIHDNAGYGWRHTSGGVSGGFVAENTIFTRNGLDNLFLDSSDVPTASNSGCATIRNCALTDSTAGAGLNRSTSANGVLILENTIFYANSTFGWSAVAASSVLLGGTNAFGANGTAARGNNATALSGDITLAGDPFVNRAANNFALTTSGGGTQCNATGFPGVLIAGGTGFASVGPLDPTTGTPGALITSPNLSGGFDA